ncbi:MAG TPA: DUF5060 domain-containing protein [Acidimicrobiia bacterium]|nr:DUF5060 domain-containing protein [Acidimicrobiia bacterium]
MAVAACTGTEVSETPRTPSSITTPVEAGPSIESVSSDTFELASYEQVELTVDLTATYDNPFDQREVTLDAAFTHEGGQSLSIPGFWDGDASWKVRFTPNEPGYWTYQIAVTDNSGTSEPVVGTITVAPSDHPGFLRIGDQVDPDYSPRYFAYEDGTPWYGRGHADLDMSLGGADPSGDGLRKFSEMAETGENYEMWWPLWGNNFIQSTYSEYSPAQMEIIDFVMTDAEAKGIAIVFTMWGHQFLRTGAHEWGDDRWGFNGFNDLTDIDGFFTDPEAWAWQENLYRYVIARWSYSPALVMWQTVTEINGTESYDHTDVWHEKVNAYFQDNDPFRHPTTATKSGAQDWPEGHASMDVPQVHIYHIFGENPIADTVHFVQWTELMWDREAKPNWAGEYGNEAQVYYPEFMHNANWASLVAGAALTPTEWNDKRAFGTFDEPMKQDMRRFSDFVEQVPLVVYDPERVEVITSDPAVRGWGLIGDRGGVGWVQDFALETATMEEIRADRTVRSDVNVTFDPVSAGTWKVTPYDTWTGEWFSEIVIDCPGGPCQISLPDFHADLALHLER